MTVIQATAAPRRARHIWPTPGPADWRHFADILAQNPDLRVPHTGSTPLTPLNVIVMTWDDPAFDAWAQVLASPVYGHTQAGARELTGQLGELHIAVLSCEKREAA